MEIRHIKYFKSVAEELSFSEAAKKLYVAQSAVSQQIGDLENELGIRLFYRSKRQVILTPAGNIFYKKSNQILDLVDEAIIETKKASKGQVGDLIIGFLRSPVHSFMPNLIKNFKEKFEGVRISLLQMEPAEQIEALLKNEIHVSFSRPIDNNIYPSIDSHLIYVDHCLAAVPKDHRLADQESISPEDLIQEPLLILSRKHSRSYFESILSFFDNFKEKPEIASEPNDIQTMLTLAQAGCGIAIVPACVAAANNVDLKFIPLSPSNITADLLVHWKNDQENVIVEAFLEQVKALDIGSKQLAIAN